MFFIQLISDQDWHKLDFILTIVISTITAGFVVWRILISIINRKANKSDLIKLEKNMEAQIENLEKTNYQDHQNIREDSINLFKSIQEHIKTVAAFVKKE